MQTAPAIAAASTPLQFPNSSKSLEAFDKRTRQISDIAYRLHCEGAEITESLLLSEGVSLHEQSVHWTAAKQLLKARLNRQLRAEPADRGKTDEQLIDEALAITGGLVDVATVVAAIRGKLLWSHDQLARLWPKIAVKLAARIATAPIPGAN